MRPDSLIKRKDWIVRIPRSDPLYSMSNKNLEPKRSSLNGVDIFMFEFDNFIRYSDFLQHLTIYMKIIFVSKTCIDKLLYKDAYVLSKY